ncbi:MAG: glycerol-3-phosphate ABC transporter [Proteobacteria bacterium SG_bin7]|nr:MAG: glycerol-3-phosphate ABC transporter [Proteobacteria bacterium SG_bin7]
MDLLVVGGSLVFVVWLYFQHNPLEHGKKFMFRRFVNWFPLGMTYAFLYMARYNLNVSKNALGNMMTKEDFGIIFGVGTFVYGFSFLLNGPLVDKIGGKKGIIIAALGSCVANVMMGIVTYLFLKGQLTHNLVVAMSCLYGLNMFFQSYGAVSIIKVKAYWFHVRERGIFGAIFGTLISFGVYFAFDWGQAIIDASKLKGSDNPTAFQNFIRSTFAIDTGTSDAIWLVFFIPAFVLIIWALIDMVLLKDTPSQANFDDFDTHDASSGEMEEDFTIKQLLTRIFTNPIMLTIALVEFTTGVVRNGVLQWYFIFAKEVPQPGAEFFLKHWGLLLCITGILGGFTAGLISDKLFQSRRGPPAAILNAAMIVLTTTMSFTLFSSPVAVGSCAVLISLAVIGVHAIMSGTAAADFGGRKATATASGIVDGCVYLGSGVQSFCLGYLTSKDWHFWPLFLVPFTVLGLFFSWRMWQALPAATRRYLVMVEKVTVVTQTVKTKTVTITE